MAKSDQSGTEKFDSSLYRSAVGSLLYLSDNTRPDLTFTVPKVSQFNQNPTMRNWQQVKHVFRYLKGTKHSYCRTGKPIKFIVTLIGRTVQIRSLSRRYLL